MKKSASLQGRVTEFVQGYFHSANLRLADAWLRLACGLLQVVEALVKEAKGRIKNPLEAEKYAKREFQTFLRQTFDQNVRGFGIATIEKHIDVYLWAKPILLDFWKPEEFDKTSDQFQTEYAKILVSLQKNTVFDMSRVFSPDEAKEVLGRLYDKRKALTTNGCSNGYIFKAIEAEAQRLIKENQEKNGKETKEDKKVKKVNEKTSESAKLAVNLPGQPEDAKLKDMMQWSKAFCDYLKGVSIAVDSYRKDKADWYCNSAIAGQIRQALDLVDNSISDLCIEQDERLLKDKKAIDRSNGYEIRPVDENGNIVKKKTSEAAKVVNG